jgi:SEL1 protein
LVDGLPKARPDIEEWVNIFSADDGNATLITLCVCLLTVLYLRQRQRRIHYGHVSS